MSNIKLYTETEILSLLKIHLADEEQADSFVAFLTPIELPSDEDEEKAAFSLTKNLQQHMGFNIGAKWMRDKIQGGNNENI